MTDNAAAILIREAMNAQRHAYVPYSRFRVGAALLCSDGTIYQGCNIENSSYGAANCAERTAFFKAVYDGHRDFDAIAIVGNHEGTDKYDYCPPCGICRQVMAEFCDGEKFQVILARSETDYRIYPLKEILPFAFTPKNLIGDEG